MVAFVAIFTTALVQADEPADVQAEEAQLGISMDISYVSRNLFYGVDLYPDNDPKISTSVALDLWGTGFSAIIAGNWSPQSGHETAEKYDYIIAYSGVINEDDTLQTNYVLNYGYYDFDNVSSAADQQELGALFVMPNLLGDSGVVPHYRVVKLWPDGSQVQNNLSGWVHAIGFDYGFTVDCPEREDVQQAMVFTADLVYNDGYFHRSVEHDWSHANFTLAAPMECPMGGTVTPSLTYQMTMEESVNTDDEIIFGVKYSFAF